MREHSINSSDLPILAKNIKAGDRVLLSGVIYTARDAAHKKLMSLIENGEKLPFEIKGAVIYYAGPTPTPHSDNIAETPTDTKIRIIGSCGPTTSGRMDTYTPKLLDMGLAAMIGKGRRNKAVLNAICRNDAVYLCALGGAGALYASCVETLEVIAFPELGCESIKRLTVKNMPLIAANDASGGNLFCD